MARYLDDNRNVLTFPVWERPIYHVVSFIDMVIGSPKWLVEFHASHNTLIRKLCFFI